MTPPKTAVGTAAVPGVNTDLDTLAGLITGNAAAVAAETARAEAAEASIIVSTGAGPGTIVVFAQSPYAVLPADVAIYASTAGGTVQIVLPANPTNGRLLVLKKITSDGNIFIVNPNGKNIEGAAGNLNSVGGSLPAFTLKYDAASGSWWILSGLGAAVGSGGFDPSQQLLNLAFWSRANDLKMSDGALVNRWPNRTGNGDWLVPSFVNAAPAFKLAGPNGLPSINFDIASAPALWIPQPTVVPAFDPNGASTYVLVWKWTSLTGTFRRGLTVKQPNGNGCSYVTDANGSIGSLTNATFVGTDGANPATAAAGVWHIATYIQTGSVPGPNVSKLYINGTQKGANNAVEGQDTTGNPIGLGAFYMTGTSRPDSLAAANEKFEVAEILIFTQALSDADRATLNAYLAAKYAIPYP